MSKIRTHYDNLKVAQDAPIEVIRAAYRSLSQKHHPDKNPGDTDAHRVMSIINRSYEVLSDPEQRQQHDEWIAQQMALHTAQSRAQADSWQPSRMDLQQAAWQHQQQLNAAAAWRRQQEQIRAAQQPSQEGWLWGAVKSIFWLTLMVAVVIKLYAVATDKTDIVEHGQQKGTQSVSNQPYQRPDTAPNGQPWPKSADYIPGYPVLAEQGYGFVQVDNRGLHSDVLIQLYQIKAEQSQVIRTAYVPAGQIFTMFSIGAGRYQLHYQQLADGVWQQALPVEMAASGHQAYGQNIHIVLKRASAVE